jgi:MYXO-CTERM domain-containing protein
MDKYMHMLSACPSAWKNEWVLDAKCGTARGPTLSSTGRMLKHLAWVLAASAPLLLAPVEAEAHGRFPQAGMIAADPTNPDRIFVRTTYGATVTEDHGATWYWVCPESMGFNSDKEDPPVLITGDGTLVMGTFGGLSVSHDGCDFVYEGDDLLGRFFVDVQPGATAADAMAVSSNGIDNFAFEVNLWATDDSGASWQHVGVAPPADFLALGLGVAQSNPERIYLTGRDGTSDATLVGAVYRSDDGGDSWTRFDVPGTGATSDEQTLPYIGGVDPNDEDTVYVGVITTRMNVVTNFELLVSHDGGAMWESIFDVADEVSGFAISPDGENVAIAGPKQGLFTAPASTLAFTKVSDLHIRCLTWAERGIYACTDQFVDGYSLGLSEDEGVSFTPLAELGSPCGPPPSCGTDTSTGAECITRWPLEKLELNATGCDGAAGGAAEPTPGDESCSCRVPGEGGEEGAFLTGVGLAAAFAIRRRRSKSTRN